MAKRQSSDLQRTGEFFDTLLTHGSTKDDVKLGQREKQYGPPVNMLPLRVDTMARFSEPPAPPPKQPLPEKPDVARGESGDSFVQPGLRRSETEKIKAPAGSSPTKGQPSHQVVSLVEALASARREIETQTTRVKNLEGMLQEERIARESAEDRAQQLARENGDSGRGSLGSEDTTRSDERPTVVPGKGTKDQQTPSSRESGLITDSSQVNGQEDSVIRLQRKLETMMTEMKEMRQLMENYKRRAEVAEEENVSNRRSLAEMVEKIRRSEVERGERERQAQNGASTDLNASSSLSATFSSTPTGGELRKRGNITHPDGSLAVGTNGVDDDAAAPDRLANGKPTVSTFDQSGNDGKDQVSGGGDGGGGGVGTSTTLTRMRRPHDHLVQSAPYASILGVVALGFGLMAYLNGWQKVER